MVKLAQAGVNTQRCRDGGLCWEKEKDVMAGKESREQVKEDLECQA